MLNFCQFYPGVAYKSVAYKKSVYLQMCVFRSNRKLLQHLNTARKKSDVRTARNEFNDETPGISDSRCTIYEYPERFC